MQQKLMVEGVSTAINMNDFKFLKFRFLIGILPLLLIWTCEMLLC